MIQTTFATGNPWAGLFALVPKDAKLPRREYNWAALPAGKKLYMEKARVRHAAKALALYLKRNGINGKAHGVSAGLSHVWWEKA